MARRAGDYLVYLIARVIICIIQACSLERCDTMAKGIAWIAADVLRLRHKTVEANLKRAFPNHSDQQRHAILKKMWAHLFLMICEIAHAPRRLHRSNWRQFVNVTNEQMLVGMLISERPAVIVTGHYGNFEMSGFLSGLFGFPTYTIARPLDNRYVRDFFNRFREATGQFMLDKDGSANDVQRVLDNGETLGLLADQHAGPKGCWVEMFGQPTSCHKAVALFSLTSGAPIAVMTARRSSGPLHFELATADTYDPMQDHDREFNVRSLTQWYCDHLENFIRQAPEQYWWVHRIWRGERPKRKKRQRAAA